MKIEQIVDEMQASLTKLRGRLRDKGTATEDIAQQVPLHYCTCPTEIPCPVHDKNYQELKKNLTGTAGLKCHKCGKHFEWAAGGGSHNNDCSEYTCPDCNKLKTAGECNCTHRMFPNPDCPKHGWQAIFKEQKATYDRIHKPPDLPLNVKVAQALGYVIWTDPAKDYRYAPTNNYIPEGCEYPIVPDYPNDLVAAIGALEEYCEKHRINYKIDSWWSVSGGFTYNIVMQSKHCGDDILYKQLSQSPIELYCLPQAICEAIVAHSEGK